MPMLTLFIATALALEMPSGQKLFCQGKAPEAAAITRKLIDKSPGDAEARLDLFLYDPAWRGEMLQALPAKPVEKMVEWERLLGAEILVWQGSPDLARAKALLDFRAVNRANEALRLSLYANIVSVEGDAERSFTLQESSYRLSPSPESLIMIFGIATEKPELADRARRYYPRIAEIPGGNPWHAYALGLKALIETGSITAHDEKLRDAHLACPNHPHFKLLMIDFLRQQKKYADAEALVRELNAMSYTPAYLSLFALYLALEAENLDDVKRYLRSAKRSEVYFRAKEREYLAEVEASLASELVPPDQRRWTVVLVLAAVTVFGVIGYSWVMGRRRTRRGRVFVEDRELLERAEREAKGDVSAYTPIARFSSAEGVRDPHIIEMIAKLNSQGLHARYRTMSVGETGGALVTYVIEVPPDEVEEARRLLQS